MRILRTLLTFLCLFYAQPSNALLSNMKDLVDDFVNEYIAEPLGCSYFDTNILPGIAGVANSIIPFGTQTADMETGKICVDSILRVGSTIAAVSAATPLTLGASILVGMPLVVAQFTNIGMIAKDTARKAKICLDDIEQDGHPGVYTNEQIKQLLEKSGEPVNVKNIVEKYDKLCIEYEGRIFWIGDGGCFDPRDKSDDNIFDGAWALISGSKDAARICVSRLSGYQYFLCARVIGACPCMMNLQMGTIDVKYESDDNGAIKFNQDNGSPIIKNHDKFMSHFSKHCRVIRAPFLDAPEAKFFDGIIDETCRSLKGHSKTDITITGGIVQCLVNTGRNIFEKPIFMNTANVAVSPKNREHIQKLESDIKVIEEIEEFVQIYAQDQLKNLNNNFDVKKYISDITSYFNNAYNPEKINFYDKYECGSIENIILIYSTATETRTEQETFIINSSTAMENYFKDCKGKVDDFKKVISTSVFQEGMIDMLANGVNSGMTMAERFQSSVKFVGIIAIFLWVVVFGYNALGGNIKLDIRSNLKYAMEFGIVYYFAFSTAWRDMFLDIVLNASQGTALLFYKIGESSNSHRDLKICDFSARSAELKYDVNGISCSTSQDLFCDAKDAKNTCIRGKCIPKPFIDRPNYEKPYVPYSYQVATSQTTSFSMEIPIYCRVNQDNEKEAAKPAHKYNGRWQCPQGYTMDRGYTVGALKEMGILSVSMSSSMGLDDNSIIKTADYHYDEFDMLKRAKLSGLDTVYKGFYLEFLERERGNLNRDRSYPKITTPSGAVRDMSYLQLFDSLDCKIIAYLKMAATEGLDVSAIKNTEKFFSTIARSFPLGWIVLVVFSLFAFLLALFVLQAFLTYVISVLMIIILAYVSPVFFLFRLFKVTKGNYDTWYKTLQSYVFTPATTFFSVSLFMQVFDFSMFGSPENYDMMFNANGDISTKCYTGRLSDAPILCLQKRVMAAAMPVQLGFLGQFISFVQGNAKLYLLLVAKLIQGLIVIYASMVILERLEKMIKTFFDIGKGDTSFLGFDGSPTKGVNYVKNTLMNGGGKKKGKSKQSESESKPEATNRGG